MGNDFSINIPSLRDSRVTQAIIEYFKQVSILNMQIVRQRWAGKPRPYEVSACGKIGEFMSYYLILLTVCATLKRH